MSKTHVLVLSPHTGIAEGLCRLLTFEGRFDARRAASTEQLGGLVSRWQADVVLVDGTLLRNAPGVLSLPAPALLLTGTREDAEALLPRLPTAKGWLRKDPTYPELERALADAGATAAPLLARRARWIALLVFALLFLCAAIASAWLVFN